MKKLMLICFCLSIFIGYGQIPNYFDNNPTWSCSLWDSDQWNPTGGGPFTENYVYYIKSDTVILGNNYHHIYRRGYKDYFDTQIVFDEFFDESTDYFLRQMGRTIRFIGPNYPVDTLLVSYEYNIGDTVQGHVFQEFPMDTIQKIDSILINSAYHRVLYLDTINGPTITEGIGHKIGGIGTIESGEFLIPLVEGIGFGYLINCYGQNDIPVWDSQGNGGDCFLNVGIDESTLSDNIFGISPNPATEYVNIDFLGDIPITIRMYDLKYSLILETNDLKINVSTIPRGTYLVEFSNSQNQRSVKKIILN